MLIDFVYYKLLFIIFFFSLKTMRAEVWRARSESPLFSCSTYANGLERLYRAMWDKNQRGEKPDHILSLENY